MTRSQNNLDNRCWYSTRVLYPTVQSLHRLKKSRCSCWGKKIPVLVLRSKNATKHKIHLSIEGMITMIGTLR